MTSESKWKISYPWLGIFLAVILSTFVMPGWSGYRDALLVLTLIVTVHEAGHFLLGRLVGLKIEVFSVFFGPAILSRQIYDVNYKLGIIPLGGYVKAKLESTKDKDSLEDLPWPSQIVFALGGIIFNLVSAYLVCLVLFMTFGQPQFKNAIGVVEPGSLAEQADMRTGDRILLVNGRTVETMHDVIDCAAEDLTLEFKLDRNDWLVSIKIEREQFEQIGIYSALEANEPLGWKEANQAFMDLIAWYFDGLYQLFTGQLSIKDDLLGPVGIIKLGSELVAYGIFGFLYLFVLLSMAVAIFNALPLPPLDGGHVVFALMEAVGLKLDLKTRLAIALVFTLWLLGFVFWATLGDLGW